MRRSKLQKLDPSANDKCAMVFVPSLAVEKLKKLRRFVNYKCVEHLSRLLQIKRKDDDQIKFILQLAIDTKFFHCSFVNPCTM